MEHHTSNSVVIQMNEVIYRLMSANSCSQSDLAYRRLCIFAMRHYKDISRKSSSKDLLARPTAIAQTSRLRELTDLAQRLEFHSLDITALQQYSKTEESTAIDKNDKPSLVSTVKINAKRIKCGLSCTEDYRYDRAYLFLPNLHDERHEQAEEITSFFRMRSVHLSFCGSLSREITEDLRRLSELAAGSIKQYGPVKDHIIIHQHETIERQNSPLLKREDKDDSAAHIEPSHEVNMVPGAECQGEKSQVLMNTSDGHDEYSTVLDTAVMEVDEIEHRQTPQQASQSRASVLLRRQQSELARRRKLAARFERIRRIEAQGLTPDDDILEDHRVDHLCPIPEHESLGNPVAHEGVNKQESAEIVPSKVVQLEYCQGAIGPIDQTNSEFPHIGDSSDEVLVASAFPEVAKELSTEKHGARSVERQDTPGADILHGQAPEESVSTMNQRLATIGEQATETDTVAGAETGIKQRVSLRNTEINGTRDEAKIFGGVVKEQRIEQARLISARKRRKTADSDELRERHISSGRSPIGKKFQRLENFDSSI